VPKRRDRLTAASYFAIAVVLASGFLFPASAYEQEAQAPSNKAPANAAPAPSTSSPSNEQVHGYTLSPEQEAQAIAYARARHELYFVDAGYELLLLVLILGLRIAPAYRDWAARGTGNSFGQIVVFTPLLMLTMDVLSLPTAAWGHRLARQYHQSIQGWGSWLADWSKGEGIGIAIGILVVWILFAVIRRSPRKWWFWFWLAAVPLIILGAVVEPLIIEPRFFKFTPLAETEPQLAARIEQMTVRARSPIPENRIFEMVASAKLNELNAYVTGLGASKRVVVWDTTIRQMTPDEVLFVTGHEMGHYVLDHVRDGILFACGVLVVFLYLAYRLLRWMLAHWGETWAIRGPGDLAALPALALLLSIFGFLFTPVSNAYSRHLEHQADQYGLEVIHGLIPDSPAVAARSFQILGEVDLEEPHPSTAVKFWFYNHPPLEERMRFAETYNPWAEGRAPEFVK
jgi:Zn-dependent protease with chaperone function